MMHRLRHPITAVAGCILLAAIVVFAGPWSPARSTGAPAAVSVYPSPGDPVAAPQTQITLRGVPISDLGPITVTGSESGAHNGRLEADSDGDGGSFLPSKGFAPGERVTVATGLNVLGGHKGDFSFTVASPAPHVPAGPLPAAARVSGDVDHFVSAPSLTPAAVKVAKLSSHVQSGDVFVAPQAGPTQYGPMILGPDGGLVWFDPLPGGQSATDFRVQAYQGKPVLTWWQGVISSAGTGAGVDQIYNSSYAPVATVRAGNGLQADLHEFQLTPKGSALITAYYPVYWNTSSVKGAKRAVVLDAVVQEIDVKTGLVLSQWDSLQHVPLTDSESAFPKVTGHPYDYFHVNSIQQLSDGNLLISARNTWAVYDVNPGTGAILWQLNGKHSSFNMGKNTSFAFQHDARESGNGEITIFDDGAGPPKVEGQSRGLTLRLNTKRMTASLVRADGHSPSLLADFEGGVQLLPNGDDFVGWGQQPYITEFDQDGATVFDARFVADTYSYRAYLLPWQGTPRTTPSTALRSRGAVSTVYASWNGATAVASWRVRAGASQTSMRTVATARRTGFETAVKIPDNERYYAVQALNATGKVLSTSPTTKI